MSGNNLTLLPMLPCAIKRFVFETYQLDACILYTLCIEAHLKSNVPGIVLLCKSALDYWLA